MTNLCLELQNSYPRIWGEAYAIVYCIEKFSYFLKGPTPFTLLTDHRSLTHMDKNIFSNAKIARWQERLSPYNFICQYIEWSANNFANMFSRPFISVKKSSVHEIGKVLGQFYKVPDSPVKIYIPSWTLGSVVLPHKIIL